MIDVAAFPIATRWPAQHPERIQLYSAATPNGVKVGIMLEETGLAYEPHYVDIGQNETWTPAFLSLNPNGKIPAIIDPDGPGGRPFGLFESGAILIYLAEKTGLFLSADPERRYQTIQWVMWQMGGAGPIFGQLGYFHRFAGREIEDKRPLQRYVAETRRLLDVIEQRLGDGRWIMGDEFSIADMALIGWVRTLTGFYDAAEILDFASLKAVPAWLDRAMARPGVARGLTVPAKP